MPEGIPKIKNESSPERLGKNSKVYKVGEKFVLTNKNPDEGVEVTPETAQRMSERLDFAMSYKDSKRDTPLGKELASSNCFGSVSMVFELSDPGKSTLSFKESDVSKLVEYVVHETYDSLKDALQNLNEAPLIITFGPHENHTVAFMGFNEAGEGIIFQKGNLSENYPWEVITLNEAHERYCVDSYRKRFKGIRVYRPNIQSDSNASA